MIEPYLSSEIRDRIEQRFYARINDQARIEQLIRSPHFIAAIEAGELDHPGLFSDHGVTHVRDIANRVVEVLEQAHGTLIPARAPIRFARMRGYGILVAYFHDVGMFDFSEAGRAMHPEYAAQLLFRPELDGIFNSIWKENSGNLAWHLTNLAAKGLLVQPPRLVLREMLALSMAHSKSKVPTHLLNDPAGLRRTMIEALRSDLPTLYLRQQQRKLQRPPLSAAAQANLDAIEAELARQSDQRNPDLAGHYQRIEDEAFLWLLAESPAIQALQVDVIDTLRALRCADALRQRGTVLTTSSGYEIFVDQRSANALFGLRLGSDRLYLLEVRMAISAGEANLASSELDAACDLRISFHHGSFSDEGANDYAAESAAWVVHDIMKDVIGSFERPEGGEGTEGLRASSEIQVVLEETDDRPQFVEEVRDRLAARDESAGDRVRIAPSLTMASELERTLYLAAPPLDWDLPARRRLLGKVGDSGHRVEEIDPEQAFDDVKKVHLLPGQLLLEAGAPAAFVYIPLEPGLRILPTSGHRSFMVAPWMPLGVTGVLRGAPRNATVQAEAALSLLMIPRTVYLKHWHRTHTPESLREALQPLAVAAPSPPNAPPFV